MVFSTEGLLKSLSGHTYCSLPMRDSPPSLYLIRLIMPMALSYAIERRRFLNGNANDGLID